jgi:hypothetical protein
VLPSWRNERIGPKKSFDFGDRDAVFLALGAVALIPVEAAYPDGRVAHPSFSNLDHPKSWVPHPFHSFIVEWVGTTNLNQQVFLTSDPCEQALPRLCHRPF